MRLEKDLDLALRATSLAGALALHHREHGLFIESKADESPVTQADRQAEAIIVRSILEEFPEDGLLGEEGASREAANGRRWIIDPIDGTRDFVRNIPHWAVFLALEVNGVVELGVVRFPALGEVYWAVRGEGAYRNGSRIQVSGVTDPGQAMICLNGLDKLSRLPFAEEILPWTRQFWSVRTFGGALDAVFVASGRADAWVESDLKPWDLAALSVIAQEAGAAFRNFDGGASVHAGTCIICTPALLEPIGNFFGRTG